jgi:hypothetical protein
MARIKEAWVPFFSSFSIGDGSGGEEVVIQQQAVGKKINAKDGRLVEDAAQMREKPAIGRKKRERCDDQCFLYFVRFPLLSMLTHCKQLVQLPHNHPCLSSSSPPLLNH